MVKIVNAQTFNNQSFEKRLIYRKNCVFFLSTIFNNLYKVVDIQKYCIRPTIFYSSSSRRQFKLFS